MDSALVYYIAASLLTVANAVALVTTLFTLPGNWAIVILTGLFAFIYPEADDGRGLSLVVVAVVVGLAVVGELIEFAAGAAGAKQQGASRRAMILAVAGGIVGSIAGAAIGSGVVPLLGTVVGALGGGALGAFGGAYAGEVWKGRTSDESLEAGKGALIGRLLGSLGKLAAGTIMFAIVTVDAFF